MRCLYNLAVECDPDDRHCYNCAWNPVADAERRPITRAKALGEKVPEKKLMYMDGDEIKMSNNVQS